MIRKYLYAGAVLLVIAVVVLYSVSGYITAGTPTSIMNTTVPVHGIADVPVLVNSSAISIIFVFADNATDIYFMNQSAFGGLSAYLSGNTPRSAYSYVSAHNLNSTNVFLNASSGIKEVYQTSIGTPGSYYVYAVIDSTGGSPSYNGVVNASVVYKSYSYGSWVDHSGEALVGIAALIAGVALLIYGAIRKPKTAAVAAAPGDGPGDAEEEERGTFMNELDGEDSRRDNPFGEPGQHHEEVEGALRHNPDGPRQADKDIDIDGERLREQQEDEPGGWRDKEVRRCALSDRQREGRDSGQRAGQAVHQERRGDGPYYRIHDFAAPISGGDFNRIIEGKVVANASYLDSVKLFGYTKLDSLRVILEISPRNTRSSSALPQRGPSYSRGSPRGGRPSS